MGQDYGSLEGRNKLRGRASYKDQGRKNQEEAVSRRQDPRNLQCRI